MHRGRGSLGHSWLNASIQQRKISPKKKITGQISRGRPGVIRADIPGQKPSFGGLENVEKQSFRQMDIHDPKARGRP